MKPELMLHEFQIWFSSASERGAGQQRINGLIAVALVVIGSLKKEYNLDFSTYSTKEGTQIKGAGASNTQKILAEFGEERPFLSEGGRTNRGVPPKINEMFKFLASLELEQLNSSERNAILTEFQAFLVDRVRDFHNQKKLKIEFSPSMTSTQFISSIIQLSKTEKKWGAVSQHLVGAKLQLRFPHLLISNENISSSDESTSRQGDFTINNTVFHVTVSPGEKVIEKCKKNIRDGYKVYLIVPSEKVGIISSAFEDELNLKGQLVSVEWFVSQNVDEIGEFNDKEINKTLYSLLHLYNERVNASETDKSLMIEIPASLSRIVVD